LTAGWGGLAGLRPLLLLFGEPLTDLGDGTVEEPLGLRLSLRHVG
jgi:hypothetical protein